VRENKEKEKKRGRLGKASIRRMRAGPRREDRGEECWLGLHLGLGLSLAMGFYLCYFVSFFIFRWSKL